MESSWQVWRMRRKRQFLLGKLSAVFFLWAALALLDGLQMLVRTSHEEVSLKAGEFEQISGYCPFQNPLASDLVITFKPADAPLSFELEGFFAGYLMGNGMWRGMVKADEGAKTGTWTLTVGFRGLSEGQSFKLKVFATSEDYRRASPSFSMTYLGFAPFALAGSLALGALFFGLFTFVLGRKNLALLQQLGFAEIFRTKPTSANSLLLWCSGALAPDLPLGTKLEVLSPEGQNLGWASLEEIKNQVFTLRMGEEFTAEHLGPINPKAHPFVLSKQGKLNFEEHEAVSPKQDKESSGLSDNLALVSNGCLVKLGLAKSNDIN